MSRAIVPLIRVPDEDDLGPAMRACNIGERAFVLAKIETGESHAECARLAGYSDSSDDVLKSTGCALAHRPRVQAALLEMSHLLMRSEGPKSIKKLVQLRDDPKVKPEIQLKAASELLSRAGLSAITRHEVDVTVENLTPAEVDRRLLAAFKELGIPETALKAAMIDPSKIIDADWTEVEKTPEQEARSERYRRNHENERRQELAEMSPEERAASIAAVKEEHQAKAKARYEAAQAIPPNCPDELKALF